MLALTWKLAIANLLAARRRKTCCDRCQTALPEVDFEIVPAVLGDDAPLWEGVAIA
jgi:hypothetical protein